MAEPALLLDCLLRQQLKGYGEHGFSKPTGVSLGCTVDFLLADY
ncbi:hypothetical protein HRbin18_02092 [bacterium HR18]|nr:hypothetical protein HRbin18_02092 [bacterium HR18]